MATIRELKLKIHSTKNIQQITKAMKMVAAARLKKAQARLESARPYARRMAEVTLDLAALTPWTFNPLLRPQHHFLKNVLVLVFTGDRGMAGSFHNNVADEAIKFGENLGEKVNLSYYVIGKKGLYRFQKKKTPVFKFFNQSVAGVSFTSAQTLAKDLIQGYRQGKYERIYLFYAKYYSAMNQKPRAFQLLPIDPDQARQKEKGGIFVYEPVRKDLLYSLVPRYVESEIFRAFLETEAGELGSRMSAMSAATDSAEEIIQKYQVEFNRVRQDQITKEIIEIVGGAEALKKSE